MPRLVETLAAELEQLRERGLYRFLQRVDSPQGARITIDGRLLLNFSSNDYLGLANHPALIAAATRAIEQWGVGAGASRLLCGNLAPYEELERKLAALKRKEAAVVFASGYAANVGTIPSLVGENDVVILDKLVHASLVDGARQSGATIRVYPHNNLQKLKQILSRCAKFRRRLIVTETVFSMDGDFAPLADIVAIKEQYDAWLMLDEAHATGVFGPNGAGLAAQCGLEEQVDISVGTLSKALGCVGGFVAGSRTLIDFLRNKARSLIYSTALPPAICAAAEVALDIATGEEGNRRRAKLWENMRMLGARTPIWPVPVGEESKAVELSARLRERGLLVPAIRYPTVPKGKARLRASVTAAHSAEDITRLQHELAR
ncbi:MAG: 8-amino-7-oxononanoate synthase [Verrucomicrobiae bacterium]|nr:8-amino-7-oxononanoate synthase [Verrucomicrobiae bacterium]